MMSGTLTKTRLGERLKEDRTDWKRIDALTEEELVNAIRDDPDSFEPGADWIRKRAASAQSRRGLDDMVAETSDPTAAG